MSRITLKQVIHLLHIRDDESILLQHKNARRDAGARYMTVSEVRKRLDMKNIIVTSAGLDQSLYGDIIGYAFNVVHFKPTECKWGMYAHRVDIT